MSESQEPAAPPSAIARLYRALVLRIPLVTVLATAALVAFYAKYIPEFDFDASSEAIVLEDDPDLRYYNYSREQFGSDDYVVLALTREAGLFDDETLAKLKEITAEFLTLPNVSSVLSILNVPLFHCRKGDNPNVSLIQAAQGGYLTLLHADTDRELAAKEFVESPLYKEYLISEDGLTTAVQINFVPPEQDYLDLYNRRAALRDKRAAGELTPEEAEELKAKEAHYVERHALQSTQRTEDIKAIREIISRYESMGDLHLGGVPMVIADIIDYVKNDITKLGMGVVLLVLLMQALIFRNLRWILLPTLTCVLTVLIMMGFLGYEHWRVTIITSNFPSLLLVITIAMTMHLAVRYRELHAGNPNASNRELTFLAVRLVAKPCLFTSLTTIVGFGSLMVSQMRPVMDFGIVMAIGLSLSYVLCFLFLPAALLLFPKGKAPSAKLAELKESPMAIFARATERHGRWLALGALALFAVSVAGLPRLKVENSFVDYFRDGSPIREGMKVLDERLGGTTPLEVVLETPRDVLALGDRGEAKDYWLRDVPRARLREVHEWLDSLPQTGKVISPDTFMRMLKRINLGREPQMAMLVMTLNMLPEELAGPIIGPYVTGERDKVRIAMRVKESSKDLNRKDLMDTLNAYFFKDGTLPPPGEVSGKEPSAPGSGEEEPDETGGAVSDGEDGGDEGEPQTAVLPAPRADGRLAKNSLEEPYVTGVFVLYNNLLQNLVNSQIRTIGFVFGAIWLMFLILFRSPSLATIALVPNVLPVVVVLGALAWTGIPLDMMTIMIAAITLGIAVDDAVHYIHRFREEFEHDRDYIATMYRCHNSVGRAVYYTSITIVAGFSVLTASNFIPNVYFGIFTSLAMVVALVAAITLLPYLLITWKPLGPAAQTKS